MKYLRKHATSILMLQCHSLLYYMPFLGYKPICCQWPMVILFVYFSYFSSLAGVQRRPQRSAPTRNGENNSFPYIEMLRGRDGRDGRDGVPGPRGSQGQRGEIGPQGPVGGRGEKGEQGASGPQGQTGQKGEQGVAGPPGPRNGGVVYTRWGKISCPNTTGTELVYAGRAGGSHQFSSGGGANYLCMPNDPDYLRHQSGVQGWSYVYGAEYYHSQLFTTTMSPVLCAMLQQGWQSQ